METRTIFNSQYGHFEDWAQSLIKILFSPPSISLVFLFIAVVPLIHRNLDKHIVDGGDESIKCIFFSNSKVNLKR